MEITGKIVDATSKEPIPFTSVIPINDAGNVVGGGSVGSKTDFDGNYILKIPDNFKYDSILIRPSDYTYKEKKVKNSGQKLINAELDYAKAVQELNTVTVTAKSNATLCKEKGGTYLESTKQCKMPPRFKTPKINWQKRILVGGIVLIVMGTATYLIVKKLRN